MTALHLAARNGHTKMVEFLIKKGILVNILDSVYLIFLFI